MDTVEAARQFTIHPDLDRVRLALRVQLAVDGFELLANPCTRTIRASIHDFGEASVIRDLERSPSQ